MKIGENEYVIIKHCCPTDDLVADWSDEAEIYEKNWSPDIILPRLK